LAEILIMLASYLLIGVLVAALVYSGPEKNESYIEVANLLFIIVFWPAVGAWYLLPAVISNLPHIRNPFWTGGKS